jgi:hypothetical protein
MGRFTMDEADNYGGGSSSFFSLKNDKETARVRFLYNSVEDIPGYAVHEVEIDGKRRYVNCLRTYRDPIDMCPFCAAHMKVLAKLFLKLYDIDAGECKIWERGKPYFQKMASLSARYKPLYDEIIEVERNGKSGDKQTTYTFYPIESSEFDPDSVECAEPLGEIILDKTAEEMEAFLAEGAFPQAEGEQPRGRSSTSSDVPFEGEAPVTRRPPRSAGRRAF